MEPVLSTDKNLEHVLQELIKREPIFHHPEFGTTREDYERMTDAHFWEVGASGNRYSREYVIDTLVERYQDPKYIDIWQTKDFYCRELAPNLYLLTYTLIQDHIRVTRRSTIWQHTGTEWKILYHQGTIVEK